MEATAYTIRQRVSIERRTHLHVVVEVDEHVAPPRFAGLAVDAFGVGRLATLAHAVTRPPILKDRSS